MEDTYSHHHLVHAHHTGVVIGTIAGSCAMALAVALIITISHPKVLLHPLSYSTEVFQSADSTGSPQAGTVASQADNVFPNKGTTGAAGKVLPRNFSH